MIKQLRGQLIEKKENFLVIDVQGVGYQVFIPSSVFYELGDISEEITVHTYHYIREDSQQLFGFTKVEDRDFFILLTSVSGVGPKVGLKILSTLNTTQFVNAILKDDLVTLTSVSGVGKKMGERLVLELKDKVSQFFSVDLNASDNIRILPKDNSVEDDLFQALQTLGYSNHEIKKAYHRAALNLDTDCSVEEGIKILLKHL